MPYRWSDTPPTVLTLTPHRSLSRPWFVAVVLGTFAMITLPLFGLLGTVFVWGLLPFMLLVVGGLWWALEHSYHTGRASETLRLEGDELCLTHVTPGGEQRDWRCNIYWARAEIHARSGPVPHYITLSGNGRRVEIGAFLSEDERKALFGELSDFLRRGRV